MRLEESRGPKLLNMNGTLQLLVCDVGDNLMGESKHTLKITDALLVTQREISLEVSAEQTYLCFVNRIQERITK
jgi:hypothetical protein